MSTGNDWGVDLPTAGDDTGFGSDEYGFDEWGTEGVDSNKIGSGYLKVDRKGWYQLLIEATAKPKPYEDDDMSKTRKPSVSLRMIVQASDNGTPVGAIHYHDLILGGKGPGSRLEDYDRDRTLNFLVGIGVLKKQGDKILDPATGSTKIQTSTLAARLNKMIVIGKLEMTPARTDEKSGRSYPERIEFPWGRGVFHPSAKEVAHHKWLDHAALKAAGFTLATPNA